jgi:hypothetical protein
MGQSLAVEASDRSGRVDEPGRRMRLDQRRRRVEMRFAAGGSAWELVVPYESIEHDEVRVTVRELGSKRRAEATALVPWRAYVQMREWLGCLPDGYLDLSDAEPALTLLRDSFSPLLFALSL